jgi:predicted DNA binding protein
VRRVEVTARPEPSAVHPLHRVVVDDDRLDRAVLLAWRRDVPCSLVRVEGRDPVPAVEAAAARVDAVASVAVARVDDGCLVHLRQTRRAMAPSLAATLDRDSLLVPPPVTYGGDGRVEFDVFGTAPDLRALVAEVDDAVGVSVRTVDGGAGHSPLSSDRLTDRQAEAVRVADRLGYLAVPREATVDDVAAAMGIAPETAAEHLRKAAARVLPAVARRRR